MVKNENHYKWAFAGVLVVFVFTSGCREEAKYSRALQGIVEFEERDLAFETGGRVRDVMVREGDIVRSGQPLAYLDDRIERAVLVARGHEAEAALAQQDLLSAGVRREDIRATRARLDAAKAQEAYLSKTLARHRKLEGGVGATPAAIVDEVATRLRAATADRMAIEQQLAAQREGARPQEISSAKARTAVAAASVELENEKLRRHELRAPIDGTVLDIPVEADEVVAPGAPVLVIADTQHPYADVFVPQGKLDGIAVGTKAQLFVDATDEATPGVVENIARRAEFTPRFLFSDQERPNLVIRVRIRLDDPQRRLHAGVPAFVYLDPTPAVAGNQVAP